jgi:ABC-type glutathione transport system ATPase component
VTEEALLSVQGLTVDFPTPTAPSSAVRGVTYDVHPGEVLGIVGESGSGKSVSSLAVMGLLPRSAKGQRLHHVPGGGAAGPQAEGANALRGKQVAMIFQDPMTSLDPVYAVGWQVAEGVRAHNDVSKKEAHDRAVDLLQLVGIPDAGQRAGSYPHELSGGMRQRVVHRHRQWPTIPT